MIGVADLQGHWQRDWIKAPGFEDHTTRVHWMQAGALFADIRVPLDRPDLIGRDCLADLTQLEMAQLLAAEGFAGTITVAENRCTWHREINWHGEPDINDIGLMSFNGGALIEDGVLAEYRELWRRRPNERLRGHRLIFGDQRAVLIENHSVFLVAVGPVPQGNTTALVARLQTSDASADALRRHFESTYCMGYWDGESGIAELATNPFCEGRAVLQRGSAFHWSGPTFDGETQAQILRAA
ncbi:hypothetical protein [uncultured Roseobacter sp.]|uniref:hypothetical protein n=1 Tax=uncultured Roseobacter sp. TaxID=114847 RepID=UPI002615FC3B|nr:hypothetical protein [uncultured Roseobacter sp.]